MTIILFDDLARESLLPLTYTRPVSHIRIGILTIAEKWIKRLNSDIAYLTVSYLQEKYPFNTSPDNIFINGSVCPDDILLEAISNLNMGDALYAGEVLIAVKGGRASAGVPILDLEGFKLIPYSQPFTRIRYPEQIFLNNEQEINRDFKLLTLNRSSASLSGTNTLLGDNIFVEEGVEAECSIFNSLKGPIYLGKNAEVWEGSMIRGAFALCDHAQIKMGSRIYPNTTIGPFCRMGGEINNSVVFGYSAKGHDGYLGNSVLGEWCNLGADTNNSNLKNNYSSVKLWDYSTEAFRDTGLQFCGLIMGDHSKSSINTMFNTGTVVGISANIFGSGFPSAFVPDFSWANGKDNVEYRFDNALETMKRAFSRKHKNLDIFDENILSAVFNLTKHYRK